MTHADDEGMVVPPRIAPYQVILVPVIKKAEDEAEVEAEVEVEVEEVAEDIAEDIEEEIEESADNEVEVEVEEADIKKEPKVKADKE